MFVYPPIIRDVVEVHGNEQGFLDRLHSAFKEIKGPVLATGIDHHKWLGAQARKQRQDLRKLQELAQDTLNRNEERRLMLPK